MTAGSLCIAARKEEGEGRIEPGQLEAGLFAHLGQE